MNRSAGEGAAGSDSIDRALAVWRQGDVAVDAKWFFHAAMPGVPLTAAAAAEGEEEGEDDVVALPAEVDGLAVVSQTCDIVRTCVQRPFVEVSPLCRPEPEQAAAARRGRSRQYAHVPGLQDPTLVVDLDRTMTVEKSIVATWQRVPGCRNDAEMRAFARALARKRERFAFPDTFVATVVPLQKRLIEKHDKETQEGRALRALREVRVQATPSWDTPSVLFFWFIRLDGQPEFQGLGWDHWLAKWLALLEGRTSCDVDGVVTTLADMSAESYVGSDPLDLDHLSS